MASFAEMIYGTAQKTAESIGKGTTEAFASGVQIAQHVENIKAQRQQVEQKKQELELAKFEKVGGLIETYAKMPEGGAKQAFGKNYIPNTVQALGLADKVNPLSMDMMLKDSKLASFVISEIKAGNMTMAQANDPAFIAKQYPQALQMASAEEIAATAGQYGKTLGDAETDARNRQSAERAAQARAGQAEQRQTGTQTRFDQSQKTKLADKVTALGIPGLKNSLASLDTNIPGGLDGYKQGTPIPGISGADAAIPTNRLKGKANKIRGDVISVGNQIIKLRTGAAMSDSEALRLMAEIGLSPTIGEGGTWTGLAWKGSTSETSFINGMRRAKGILDAQETVYKNAYTPEVYDSVVPPTGAAPAKSGEPKFDVSGHMMTKAQMQKFVAANPKDPASAVMRKYLGGK